MLIVLCGPSYSGKSVLSASLATAGAEVISLDEINARRGLWGGDGIPVEEWIATHAIAREEISAALAAGRDVVVDDTASMRSLRDGWRELAASIGAEHRLVVLDVDRDILLQRHEANRTTAARGQVSDAVLAEHLDGFEWPAPDEPALVVAADDDPADVAARLLAPPAPRRP